MKTWHVRVRIKVWRTTKIIGNARYKSVAIMIEKWVNLKRDYLEISFLRKNCGYDGSDERRRNDTYCGSWMTNKANYNSFQYCQLYYKNICPSLQKGKQPPNPHNGFNQGAPCTNECQFSIHVCQFHYVWGRNEGNKMMTNTEQYNCCTVMNAGHINSSK